MVGQNEYQDIAQLAFLKAWQARKSFQARSQTKTWIYRIAVNCIIDHLRKQGRESSMRIMSDVELISHSQSGEPASDELLTKSLGQIEVHERMILTLHYFEGLSLKEISAILKVSEGTVKSRLFMAREKLRAKMLDETGERNYEVS